MKRLLLIITLTALIPTLTLAALELAARTLWPSDESADKCIRPDPEVMYAHSPSCHYSSHIPESEPVDYRYDECGLRTVIPCTFGNSLVSRIAFVGDSFTEAMAVSAEDGYAWRSRQELLNQGFRVEVINLGVSGYDLLQYHERLKTALAFKPRLIVLGLLPNDLFDDPSFKGLQKLRDGLATLGPARLMEERERAWRSGNFLVFVRYLLSKSTAATMLQHYVYAHDTIYLATYLARGVTADYLQREFSPEWEEKVAGASDLIGRMHEDAHRAGAEFIVLFIPQRIQAAMISAGNLDHRVDPSALARRLHDSLSPAIRFMDFLEALRTHPHPSALYFPVDGHLTKEGHTLLAKTLSSYLINSGLLKEQ